VTVGFGHHRVEQLLGVAQLCFRSPT